MFCKLYAPCSMSCFGRRRNRNRLFVFESIHFHALNPCYYYTCVICTLNAIQITQAVTSYEHHTWDEFIPYTVHTLWISYGACIFQFFVCKQVAVFPLGFNSMCTEHWKKIANLFILANLLFVANLLLLVFSFSLF